MKLIIFKIFIIFTLTSFGQTDTDESLIVVHYDEANRTKLGQLIYRYNFINNTYAGRDMILSVDGRKNGQDYIRFDKGENTIYKNRYLISGIGNIIDLKDKKVLHDGSAKLIRCSNDSIIFFTNDIFKGKYFSFYDLKSKNYSEIKSLTFNPIIGQDVEFDRKKSPYKLEYYPQGKPKVLLMEDAGHGGVTSVGKKADIPLYWIDDNTFIFPNIKITDSEGTIVKYNLTTKTGKILGTFNSTSKIPAFYELKKGLNSLIEFYFKDKLYLINPIKETMLISSYKDFSDGFSIEVENKPNGRSVYYKGNNVGRNNFQLINFKTSPYRAAILKEIVIGEESYQKGLAFFNNSKLVWENIETEEIASLVGWIKK